MRFFAATFFFAAAAYVWWYNQNHLDRLVLRWIIDLVAPATRGDPRAQGEWTVNILLGVGGVFFLRDLIDLLRRRRVPPA